MARCVGPLPLVATNERNMVPKATLLRRAASPSCFGKSNISPKACHAGPAPAGIIGRVADPPADITTGATTMRCGVAIADGYHDMAIREGAGVVVRPAPRAFFICPKCTATWRNMTPAAPSDG